MPRPYYAQIREHIQYSNTTGTQTYRQTCTDATAAHTKWSTYICIRSRCAVMAKNVHIIAPIHIRMEHACLQKGTHHAGVREYVQHHITMLQISGLNRIVVHVLVSVGERTQEQRGVYVMCIVNILASGSSSQLQLTTLLKQSLHKLNKMHLIYSRSSRKIKFISYLREDCLTKLILQIIFVSVYDAQESSHQVVLTWQLSSAAWNSSDPSRTQKLQLALSVCTQWVLHMSSTTLGLLLAAAWPGISSYHKRWVGWLKR